jgi:hypothetical protein
MFEFIDLDQMDDVHGNAVLYTSSTRNKQIEGLVIELPIDLQ